MKLNAAQAVAGTHIDLGGYELFTVAYVRNFVSLKWYARMVKVPH